MKGKSVNLHVDAQIMPMAAEKREIHDGKCDGECSVDDFLSHMPAKSGSSTEACQQFITDGFRVFLHPGVETNTCLKTLGPKRPIDLLLEQFSDSEDDNYTIVQFWLPRRSCSSGCTVFTVSEQPFAISGVYNGLCRYRYHCLRLEIDAGGNGPVGRVFSQGSPEYCRDIGSYSTQDFPLRDDAVRCGFKQYHAFPVFKRGENRCMGVLEFLSSAASISNYARFSTLQESPVFRYTSSHERECCQEDDFELRLKLHYNMLDFVRKEHGLPLIQIWAPCISDTTSKLEQLSCHGISMDCSTKDAFNYHYMISLYGANSARSGKGLVGRAYSQQRCCFYEDTSQISISDYPLVHNTRSLGLTSCFAIPFQKTHPNRRPYVLEAFLPPQKNYDHASLEALLKSLLSTMAHQLSGLAQDEEFHVKFSHSDDEGFVFFDVRRSCRTGATMRNDIHPSSVQYKLENIVSQVDDMKAFPNAEKNHDCNETLLTKRKEPPMQEAMAESLGESFANNEVQTTLEKQGGKQPSCKRKKMSHIHSSDGKCSKSSEAATAANVIPVNTKGKSTVQFSMNVMATYRRDCVKFRWCYNLGFKELCKELKLRLKLKDGEFEIKYKDEDDGYISLFGDIDLLFYEEALQASGRSTMKLEIFTSEKSRITLEEIMQYRGFTTQEDAAIQLGVHVNTLKRSCAYFNLGTWPRSKRRKARNPPGSSAGLKKAKPVKINAAENETVTANSISKGAETRNDELGVCASSSATDSIPTNAKGTSSATGNDEIVVKATYDGDTAKFLLSCNAGIEELRTELKDVFGFGSEEFKIKYKDDDDDDGNGMITLFRDKDLHFHIQSLRASSKSTMKLLVFLVSPRNRSLI